MIQLIDKQKGIFGVENKTFQFVKPYYLLPSNEFKLKKATVQQPPAPSYTQVVKNHNQPVEDLPF